MKRRSIAKRPRVARSSECYSDSTVEETVDETVGETAEDTSEDAVVDDSDAEGTRNETTADNCYSAAAGACLQAGEKNLVPIMKETSVLELVGKNSYRRFGDVIDAWEKEGAARMKKLRWIKDEDEYPECEEVGTAAANSASDSVSDAVSASSSALSANKNPDVLKKNPTTTLLCSAERSKIDTESIFSTESKAPQKGDCRFDFSNGEILCKTEESDTCGVDCEVNYNNTCVGNGYKCETPLAKRELRKSSVETVPVRRSTRLATS